MSTHELEHQCRMVNLNLKGLSDSEWCTGMLTKPASVPVNAGETCNSPATTAIAPTSTMTRQQNARRRPRGASNPTLPRPSARAGDSRRTNGKGVATPQKPAAVPARTEVGMSPASRYNSNLRILRRRDPHILSIFDQFPHGCAYYYSISEQRWERMGYEGALFLFERCVCFAGTKPMCTYS